MSVQSIATCITVTVTRSTGWQQTATDSDASKQVASQNGVKSGRVSVQKKLLDLPACRDIKKLFTRIGEDLAVIGTPAGAARYLVPACRTERVLTLIRESNNELATLKAKLANEYSNYLNTQEIADLAGLFNADDYRSVGDVLSGTTIVYEIDVVNDSSVYAGLFSDESIVAELTAQADARIAAIAKQTEENIFGLIETQANESVTIIDKYHSNNGKRCATESAVEKLKAVCDNAEELNDTMLSVASQRVSDAINALRAALPTDHEVLKNAVEGRAFVQAVRSVFAAPATFAPNTSFDIDAVAEVAVAAPVAVPVEFDIDAVLSLPEVSPVVTPAKDFCIDDF